MRFLFLLACCFSIGSSVKAEDHYWGPMVLASLDYYRSLDGDRESHRIQILSNGDVLAIFHSGFRVIDHLSTDALNEVARLARSIDFHKPFETQHNALQHCGSYPRTTVTAQRDSGFPENVISHRTACDSKWIPGEAAAQLERMLEKYSRQTAPGRY